METIDSNQEKIAPGQIISIAAKQLQIDSVPLEAMLGSVAKEASMENANFCLLYTSPSPRDRTRSRMPSSA